MSYYCLFVCLSPGDPLATSRLSESGSPGASITTPVRTSDRESSILVILQIFANTCIEIYPVMYAFLRIVTHKGFLQIWDHKISSDVYLFFGVFLPVFCYALFYIK